VGLDGAEATPDDAVGEDELATAAAIGDGDVGPAPTPALDVPGGGLAALAVTSIAITRPDHAPPATSRFGDPNAGSFVLMPNALVASQTAARLSNPNKERAGFDSICTIQIAMTRYPKTATTCFQRFPVRNPGSDRHHGSTPGVLAVLAEGGGLPDRGSRDSRS